MEVPEANPLTPRQVEQAGALVVDVRTELQFDEAHVPGAVSITARRAGFGSKLAWLAEPGTPIVLVGRDNDDAVEAAGLAAAVGLREIAGYLAGGMTSWREERRPVATVARMTVPELHERWENGDRPQSTCASARSGTPATSPAPSSRPTTTSTACPTTSTHRDPWPSSAAPASARPSRPACSCATARAT
jgi:rhodanese-related sulfurtransferase